MVEDQSAQREQETSDCLITTQALTDGLASIDSLRKCTLSCLEQNEIQSEG